METALYIEREGLGLCGQSVPFQESDVATEQEIQEFVSTLQQISIYRGEPFGALQLIQEAEQQHEQRTGGYRRPNALSAAFKCFVLETSATMGSDVRPRVTKPLSEYYGLFVPRIVHSFRSICGANLLARNGYPLPAFTLMRDIFDSLVLTSAAVQGLANFYHIDGVEPGATEIDPIRVRKLKMQTEFSIRKKMTGSESGLSEGTRKDLDIINRLFDNETHGAQLSFATAVPWLKGQGPLSMTPVFDETAYKLFMNRLFEVEWMLHRLLPLLQPPDALLATEWREKWRVIEDSFVIFADSLSGGGEGKTIGKSFAEFVSAKFPFSEQSAFPL